MRYLLVRGRQLSTFFVTLVCWTAIGAALVTPAGVLLGICYGGLLALLYGSLSPIVPAVVRFTLCSAAAGAVVGASIRLFDVHNPLTELEPEESPQPLVRRRQRPGVLPPSLLGRTQGICPPTSQADISTW
jgi:hypothetical protein